MWQIFLQNQSESSFAILFCMLDDEYKLLLTYCTLLVLIEAFHILYRGTLHVVSQKVDLEKLL